VPDRATITHKPFSTIGATVQFESSADTAVIRAIAPSSFTGHGMPCPYCSKNQGAGAP
jgi:hypothetical protein